MQNLAGLPRSIDLIFPTMVELKDKLLRTAAEPLVASVVRGVMTEHELFNAIRDDKKGHGRKETTAQQVLAILGVDSLGELFDFAVPERVLQEAMSTIRQSFDQEYWAHIIDTTRSDMQASLNTSIADGHSVRRTAQNFSQQFGSEYSRTRATLVARTEIPDALNKGHEIGIRDIAKDNPELEIGKEWLSVFAHLSRVAHMALDGTVVPAEGVFTLNGVECTHPGHYVLPAYDRCNCLCTILSSFITNEIGISRQEDQNTDAIVQDTPKDDPVVPNTPADLFTQIKVSEKLNKIVEQFTLAKFATEAKAKFTAARDKYVKEATEITAAVRQTGWTAELRERYAEFETIKKEFEATAKGVAKEKSANAKITMKLLADGVDPIEFAPTMGDGRGMRGVMVSVSKAVQKKISEAEAFVSAISDRKIYGQPKAWTRWYQLKKGQRAHHSGNVEDWKDENKDRIRSTGMYCTAADGVSTFIHELCHSVEARNPHVKAKTNEFARERIKRSGKPDVYLKKEYPSHGYSAQEMGNDDDFGPAFEGQEISSKHYVGKQYAQTGHTEILTMGVELLYDDPAGFAQRDPEFFMFIIGILQGDL